MDKTSETTPTRKDNQTENQTVTMNQQERQTTESVQVTQAYKSNPQLIPNEKETGCNLEKESNAKLPTKIGGMYAGEGTAPATLQPHSGRNGRSRSVRNANESNIGNPSHTRGGNTQGNPNNGLEKEAQQYNVALKNLNRHQQTLSNNLARLKSINDEEERCLEEAREFQWRQNEDHKLLAEELTWKQAEVQRLREQREIELGSALKILAAGERFASSCFRACGRGC